MEVPLGVADPDFQAKRAKHHLEDLEREIAGFIDKKPYSVTLNENAQRQHLTASVQFQEVPAWFSLIAADFFFNLRAALDHAVWWLAAREKRSTRTQFPVLDNCRGKARQKFSDCLAGVPVEAVHIIEMVQPYRRPKGTPVTASTIWQLNALCNIARHRRIPMLANIMEVRFPHLRKQDVIERHENEITVPLALKGKVRFDPQFSFQIGFGESEDGANTSVQGMRFMYEHVHLEVLPALWRFFK